MPRNSKRKILDARNSGFCFFVYGKRSSKWLWFLFWWWWRRDKRFGIFFLSWKTTLSRTSLKNSKNQGTFRFDFTRSGWESISPERKNVEECLWTCHEPHKRTPDIPQQIKARSSAPTNSIDRCSVSLWLQWEWIVRRCSGSEMRDRRRNARFVYQQVTDWLIDWFLKIKLINWLVDWSLAWLIVCLISCVVNWFISGHW